MAKEFKRNTGKASAVKKGADSKKGKEKKPSFNRYRDESGTSDFGKAKKSSYTDFKATKNSGRKFASKKAAEGTDSPYSETKEHKSTFKKNTSSFDKKENIVTKKRSFDKKEGSFDKKSAPSKKTFNSTTEDWNTDGFSPERELRKTRSENYSRPYKKKEYSKRNTSRSKESTTSANNDGSVRLNKYISNAGICSRREADELIASGVVQVNGKTITEMGYKVQPTDIIKYGGQTLKKEKMVYLILNKPKDYITTIDDPQKRKTVLELVQGACRERIYPVGRLDRATTGLLLFTNDGELTKKLTHPKYGVRKIYHVELDKPLKRNDFDQIMEGIELEDGDIKVDEISYVGEGNNKKEIGIELHSGKNRIVRRIFEHLGYNVRKLDRVIFGPLNKKDLPRGRWRILTEAEVGMLKMISAE